MSWLRRDRATHFEKISTSPKQEPVGFWVNRLLGTRFLLLKQRAWRNAILLIIFSLAVACGKTTEDQNQETPPPNSAQQNNSNSSDRIEGPASVYLSFGDNFAPRVANRIESLIKQAAKRPVVVWGVNDSELQSDKPLPKGSLLLVFGNHPYAHQLLDTTTLSGLGSEGIQVRSGELRGVGAVAADGNEIEGNRKHFNLGALFAAYAALEKLGFAFLHPLAPNIPEGLPSKLPNIDIAEAPHWRIRGLQLHTMHPLELTHVLQGWGPNGTEDEAGFKNLLTEWELYLEWTLANRQNRVHWVLLEADSWADFSRSNARQSRLRTVVELAHDYGILTGIDAPIALEQQHAFRLLTEQNDELFEELTQIRETASWLAGIGLDYVVTESGTSEFTHPEDTRMIAWMNALGNHLKQEHGREIGQTVQLLGLSTP